MEGVLASSPAGKEMQQPAIEGRDDFLEFWPDSEFRLPVGTDLGASGEEPQQHHLGLPLAGQMVLPQEATQNGDARQHPAGQLAGLYGRVPPADQFHQQVSKTEGIWDNQPGQEVRQTRSVTCVPAGVSAGHAGRRILPSRHSSSGRPLGSSVWGARPCGAACGLLHVFIRHRSSCWRWIGLSRADDVPQLPASRRQGRG